MNAKDAALQAHIPVVMVPRFEPLEPLAKVGHRFLVAADGMWLEARRPWCHIVVPVALQGAVPMPYGRVERKVEMAFGKFPVWVLDRFVETAYRQHPVETAAVAFWNRESGEFRYEECEAVTASEAFLTAKWPRPMDGESLVIDLHSHGCSAPYFSGTDRKSMGSEVVIACVVGKTHQVHEVKVSVFVCGKELKVPVPQRMGGQAGEGPTLDEASREALALLLACAEAGFEVVEAGVSSV